MAIKTIVTRGDVENRTPFSEMEGKDFFTKELDQELLGGGIDLVVHSYKDLGSERPEEIELGAVTRRLYAHDVLLCSKSTVDSLKEGMLTELRIGTGSPRRGYNLKKFLGEFLPYGRKAQISILPLRGNVTTRLRRLKNGDFEGIVLALAGLERLARESEAISLLDGLDYMVLPKSVFVPAAAQGALAIEMRRDCPSGLRQAVKKLDHVTTREEVTREKSIFQSYSGGCQLAVGIHVQKKKDFFLVMERGFHSGNSISHRQLVGVRPPPQGRGMVVGRPCDDLIEKVSCAVSTRQLKNKDSALMVTSSHCLNALDQLPSFHQLFSSGVQTHKRMAERGYWVHLCADSLGESEILHLSQSEILKCMGKSERTYVLTGRGSLSSIGSVLPCYDRVSSLSKVPELRKKLEMVDSFYWTSFPQYKTYRDHFPFIANRQHACGLGKTWNAFLQEGVDVIPFAGFEEFEDWWRKGNKKI